MTTEVPAPLPVFLPQSPPYGLRSCNGEANWHGYSTLRHPGSVVRSEAGEDWRVLACMYDHTGCCELILERQGVRVRSYGPGEAWPQEDSPAMACLSHQLLMTE